MKPELNGAAGKPRSKAEQLADLADYYAKEISPGVAQLYLQALQGVSEAALAEAIAEIVQGEGRFFPRIAELLAAAQRAMPGEHCNPLAVERWEIARAFYAGEGLNRARLLEIAVMYERSGWEANAAYTREILRRMEAVEGK